MLASNAAAKSCIPHLLVYHRTDCCCCPCCCSRQQKRSRHLLLQRRPWRRLRWKCSSQQESMPQQLQRRQQTVKLPQQHSSRWLPKCSRISRQQCRSVPRQDRGGPAPAARRRIGTTAAGCHPRCAFDFICVRFPADLQIETVCIWMLLLLRKAPVPMCLQTTHSHPLMTL